jgi:hypothetical protein
VGLKQRQIVGGDVVLRQEGCTVVASSHAKLGISEVEYALKECVTAPQTRSLRFGVLEQSI